MTGLSQFALGYLVVLAAPGPNMLAVGTIAALRGLRGVLPFCLGIAAGAGGLALGLRLAFSGLGDLHSLEQAGRGVGGVLLAIVAIGLLRRAPPIAPGGAPPSAGLGRADLFAFGAGFCTAATNPITAAYCMAQFLGPLAGSPAAVAAPALVAVQALCFGLAVALVFARPAARRLALAFHRPACMAAATTLLGLSWLTLAPLLR